MKRKIKTKLKVIHNGKEIREGTEYVESDDKVDFSGTASSTIKGYESRIAYKADINRKI